jgi:hypothetical protein
MVVKMAEITITFDKLTLKTEIKREIIETKKTIKENLKKPFQWSDLVAVHKDKLEDHYLEGYLSGLRMAMCMLEEMDDGKNEVSP